MFLFMDYSYFFFIYCFRFRPKAHKKQVKELDNLVHNSVVFNQHFSGLMIEDAESGEILLKERQTNILHPPLMLN